MLMTRCWKWVESRSSSDSAEGFVEMIWESCWGSIVRRSHAPQVMKAYVEGSSHRFWLFRNSLKRSQTGGKGSAFSTVSCVNMGNLEHMIRRRKTYLSYPSQLSTKFGQPGLYDRFHVFVKPPHFLLLLEVIHNRRELDDLHLIPRELALPTCCLEIQDQEVPQFASHNPPSSSVVGEWTKGTKSRRHLQLTAFGIHGLSHG